ncbi:uncharacterized protein LOC133886091 [Phragmites australis]|uniref:uncharacterized protein LOC133886091 n=1 Tax=Phragmites australis TaxID=29695 RepID=UPI002D79F5A1|nr:uncharacterized protein LOC133886091 [Phragmites australis]
MAGGEDALKSCTCRSVEAEGVTGEGKVMEACSAKGKAEEVVSGGQVLGAMKERTTRRKAEEACSCAVVATAVAKAEDAAGGAVEKHPEEACSCAVVATAVAKAENAAGGAVEKHPGPKNRMSNSDIRWFLAHKPMAGPRHYRALKESNPDLKPLPGEEMDESRERLYFMTKAFYEMEENYPKMQAWIREELKTKGYVEVDDDWVRGRAEAKAAVEEAWKKIDAMLLSETEEEDDDDDDESDYDDDDEF